MTGPEGVRVNRIKAALRRLTRGRTVVADPLEISRIQGDLDALRAEIDELRVDSRRIAELYDLVFERLREQADGRER